MLSRRSGVTTGETAIDSDTCGDASGVTAGRVPARFQKRGRAVAARQSHKLEAEGSIPSLATNFIGWFA
jgi:hypothetical protein